MIERDIGLCRETGGRYHVTHISTAHGVDLVRQAKSQGLPITTEVAVHHVLLTDEACAGADPNTKMHPPLRTKADVQACRQGLIDGTIDCVVTDHAPHTVEEKSVGFLGAPPGIVGLETAVGLTAKALIDTGLADWPEVIAWFTKGPAGVLRKKPPHIEAGSPAELTILAPPAEWMFDPDQSLSKARNTPFGGWKLLGRPVGTVRATRVTLHPAFGPSTG
jgi:dihydroorotase